MDGSVTVRKLNIVAFILAVACAWTIACSRWESRYLKRTVGDREVVGEWVMRDASVADLSRAGHIGPVNPQAHRITVLANHQCRYQTFIDVVGAKGATKDQIDAPCEWILKRVGNHQAISFTMRTAPRRYIHYYFTEIDNGRLILFRPATDPDFEAYVEYERVATR